MPDESVSREVLGNIDGVSRWLFYALAAASLVCFAIGVWRRTRLWRQGREDDGRTTWRERVRRIRAVLWQTTLRASPGRRQAGIAHRLLFFGFGILFVGTILIAIEHYGAALQGRDPADPWFHKGLYFAIYEGVLDAAGVAFTAGCLWFLVRRLRGTTTSIGAGRADVLLLTVMVALGVTGFLTEGLRIVREQTPQPGYSWAGLVTAEALQVGGVTQANADGWHFALWWTHAVAALTLIAVWPYTRLLHAVAGATNLMSTRVPQGVMVPLSLEDIEETGVVGVGVVTDLTRNQLRQLDACVSCGRCEDLCPAHEAGKPLSPRDVVQAAAAELSAVTGTKARPLCTAAGDGPVGAEAVWSCTTCHSCVDVCPLGVEPHRLITDIRRHLVGTGQFRGPAATALQKTQRSGNPWGLPAEDRLAWAEGLDVPVVGEVETFDVLYWVGCAASYDRRTQRVARAVVTLLNAAGVRFAVLGGRERCTGEFARRMGEEFLFQELAQGNKQTLEAASVGRIVTHCPHCLNSLRHDYPQFGAEIEVVHHSEFLADLVRQGRLNVDSRGTSLSGTVTYHDPCYLARVNDVVDAPRDLVQLSTPGESAARFQEMPRRGRDTACCGAGGGRMWFDDTPAERIGRSRVDEVVETGASTVAVSCPFCLTMMSDGLAAADAAVDVRDVAELLVEALIPE